MGGMWLLLAACSATLVSTTQGQHVRCTGSWSCDFEASICGGVISHQGPASVAWRRHVGSTSSSNTGPDGGYGGSRYYIYMETSLPVGNGNMTRFAVPSRWPPSSTVCVTFAYHMHGATMGNLTLSTTGPFGEQVVWHRVGNQGSVWIRTGINVILPPSGSSHITWKATAGPSFESDIGLDAIHIACGTCATSPTVDGSVRLVRGRNSMEGRLEIRFRGVWGTVCDDAFDSRDASVACYQLGFGYGGVVISRVSPGPGHGPIWLDQVGCQGTEQRITQCRHSGLGIHDCSHSEDVHIRCLNSAGTTSSPTVTPPSRDLGNISISDAFLTKCYNPVSVTCALRSDFGPCDNVTFAWYFPDRSRIQPYHQGFQIQTLYLLEPSRHFFSVLNVTSNNYWLTGVYTCAAYYGGRTVSARAVIVIYPPGSSCAPPCTHPGHSHTTPQRPYTSTPYTTTGHGHDDTTTYRPYSSTSRGQTVLTTEFQVQGESFRLVGGRNHTEGRVEVLHNGEWGTVCDDGFGDNEATTICGILGLGTHGEVLPCCAIFGQGSGRIWLDDLDCPFGAMNITQCRHAGWGRHNCGHIEDVGIRCFNGSLGCSSYQYRCTSGECISLLDQCDGFNHCGDGSDEQSCPCYDSEESIFQCTNGACLPWDNVCDGTNDCTDNSDENRNCSACGMGYFRCDRACHLQYKRCNGIRDCADGSDERACGCPIGERRCDGYCYTLSTICGYNLDCVESLAVNCSGVHVAPKTCGRPVITPRNYNPLIVNGEEAIPHSWPWQVSLRVQRSGELVHSCGGSLISPCWVLTAAHCVVGINPNTTRISAGGHDVTTPVPFEETVSIARIVTHPNYSRIAISNDIALIQMSRCLPLSDKIAPVCLPTSDVPDNTTCTVTGWGLTDGTADRRVLQEVEQLILNQEECRRSILGLLPPTQGVNNLTNDTICTFGEERTACYGDSGGPLVCQRGDAYEVHGIVSFGISRRPFCSVILSPVVYTRVTSYLGFIGSIALPFENCNHIQVNSLLFGCDFEHGSCNIFNDTAQRGRWTPGIGSTPTTMTGPGRNSSHYIYFDNNIYRSPGSFFTQSLCTSHNDSICVSFCRYMYGVDVGRLDVRVGSVTVFSASGDQGALWICEQLTVNAVQRHTWLTFQASPTRGFRGDIAIDDMRVSKGPCAGGA